MATLNFGRSTRVVSPSFLMDVGLILVGSLAARQVTRFARDNVVDVSFPGGDAVYAVGGSALTMALLPSSYATPLALGMMAAGGQTALRDFNVV